jgi:DNA polymerase sigma
LVTALLVLTLLKNLVFGGGGDSDFYYYSYSSSSSSLYETRINPDGSRTTTETSRQESSDLKTNIPGLTGRDVIDRGSTNYFDFDFDDE